MDITRTPGGAGLHLEQDGRRVAVLTWQDRAGRRIIDHTWVSPELRGRGVADLLMRRAVECAVEDRVELGATCSYAVMWLGARR